MIRSISVAAGLVSHECLRPHLARSRFIASFDRPDIAAASSFAGLASSCTGCSSMAAAYSTAGEGAFHPSDSNYSVALADLSYRYLVSLWSAIAIVGALPAPGSS